MYTYIVYTCTVCPQKGYITVTHSSRKYAYVANEYSSSVCATHIPWVMHGVVCNDGTSLYTTHAHHNHTEYAYTYMQCCAQWT